MLGFLSQDDLTEELLSAKALVAPSLGGESFGMVLTRAFACATPVVASDIAGYRDVMTDETGVLVPPGDPDALAEAVVGLLEDEPRRERFGAAARRLAQERYSWDDIARRLAAVYEARRERLKLLSAAIPCWSAARAGHARGRAGVGALLWWRGPDWHRSARLRRGQAGTGSSRAIGFNLLSVVARALRLADGDQPGDRAAAPAASDSSSRRSRSACSRTRCYPAGSASWHAWPC